MIVEGCVQVRTLTLTLIFVALNITTAIGQESSTVQPFEDAAAYKIYSLLLPQEESYVFAKDALIIQQDTIAPDIFGACLKQADANRFKGSIADYNRVRKKKWRFQRQFQIAKPYRIVGTEIISALPARPQSAVSHVRMSPVGFNRDKTQAVVFLESSCGEFYGSWRFHFLEKVDGEWKEAAIAICVGAS
jgi:hypothetical protein